MAAVAKSWVETACPKCACRRVFELRDGWVLVCTVCGTERRLEENGILAA